MFRRTPRGSRFARLSLAAIASLLVLAGIALAAGAIGLQNASFESILNAGTDWNAQTVRDGVYNTAACPNPSDQASSFDEVCQITGSDSFTVRDGVYGTPRTVTVDPIDGTHMVRLGGPYNDSSQRQPRTHRYLISQAFVVPTDASPSIEVSYNLYTFDYSGFDDLTVRLQLTDSQGNVLAEQHQGSFGPGGNIDLKSTGWRPVHFDLTGHQGEQVFLRISSGGTRDDLFGMWAYVDGPGATAPAVNGSETTVSAPNQPGTSTPVPVQLWSDAASGQGWVNISPGYVNAFPSNGSVAHCMPLTLTVPIDPGAGTVSNAKLILRVNGVGKFFDMTKSPSSNDWTGTIDCVEKGDLLVQYDLTEGSSSQQFVVPIGGLSLIDPSGTVVDADHGNVPLDGVSVRLQRQQGSAFVEVLSGDPGISPNVNPETSGADGAWGWDVAAGTYRVVAAKAGFVTVTTASVTVPPEVTGIVIEMHRVPVPPSGGGDEGSTTTTPPATVAAVPVFTAPSTTSPPASGAAPAAAGPCSKLAGAAKSRCVSLRAALARCNAKSGLAKSVCVKQAKAVSACGKLANGKKRAACIKQAKAVAACGRLASGKKRAACLKKARHVAKKPKKHSGKGKKG